MSIRLEELEGMDWGDVAEEGSPLVPPIHPGVFLKEILEELGLSQYRLAKELGVGAMTISHVVRGARPMTAELALRLGLYLGQSPEYWLGLQTRFDLETARGRHLSRLRREIVPLRAA